MADGPLDGVRVVDLTRVWAGPLGARILADLGADVVKVEAPNGRGAARGATRGGQFAAGDPGDRPWNRQGSFNKLNRNKQSFVLDLKKPRAHELFLELVAKSDVVMENFSAGTMDDLGIGYEVLSAANPAIVYLSMPGYGLSGPYRDYVAYGPSIEPMTGLAYLLGYGDGIPRVTSIALPDATAGTVAASAVMTALWRREVTGRGAFLDLSQHEGFIPFFAGELVAHQMEPDLPPISSNRHRAYAPHNVYRCAGDDDWIAIGARSGAEWLALSRFAALGWEQDARFATLETRKANEDALDAAIEGWTVGLEKLELASMLQDAGVPAGAVMNAPELLSEPHLHARGFFVELDHPDVWPVSYPGTPVRIDGAAPSGWTVAPTLGQHNEAILGGLLGLPDSEIADLYAAGVTADRPPG